MITHVSQSTARHASTAGRRGARTATASRAASSRAASSRAASSPAVSSRPAARPTRWTPARLAVTTFFGTLCAATLALGVWWLQPLVAGWSSLTPFEQPIGWFVAAAVVLLTLATACATLAAALWPPRTAGDEP